MKASMGMVISASHNPFEHNGIKIFNGSGFKLSDTLEERIERMLDGAEPVAEKNTRRYRARSSPTTAAQRSWYVDYLAGAATADI